jgi:hypothetical protein
MHAHAQRYGCERHDNLSNTLQRHVLAQGSVPSVRYSVRRAAVRPCRAAVMQGAVDGQYGATVTRGAGNGSFRAAVAALGHATGWGGQISVPCERPMHGGSMAHEPYTAPVVGRKHQLECNANWEAGRKLTRTEAAQRVVPDPRVVPGRLQAVSDNRQFTGGAARALGPMAGCCTQTAVGDAPLCVVSSAAAGFSKVALGMQQTALQHARQCVVSSAAAGFSNVPLGMQQHKAEADECVRSSDAVSACVASPHAAQFGFDEIEFNVPWQSNVEDGSFESTCMTEEVNSFTAQRHARLASEPSDGELRHARSCSEPSDGELRFLWQSPVCTDTVQEMLMQERPELVSILSELGGSQPLDGALSVQWNVQVPGLDVQEGFGESSGA